MAHAGGRPPKLTEEERAEVLEALRLYIEREPDPTIVGFCAWDSVARSYMVTRDNIKDWPEFSPLQKIAIEKQEAYLSKGAITGQLNATFAIFRLKQPQHGWTDKQEHENTHKFVQPIMNLEEAVDALSGNNSDPQS
jgi:hypothetical protein